MGFRFSIDHANWLAHVLQPTGTAPQLDTQQEEELTLRDFLRSFEYNFYTTHGDVPPPLRSLFRHGEGGSSRNGALRRRLQDLAEYFRDLPWVALLLPSGEDNVSDRILTNRSLLRRLVEDHLTDSGLVLQLDVAPREGIALQHVFPAFKTALAEFTRWPGVLVWTSGGDAVFLELTRNPDSIQERLAWVLRRLSRASQSPDLVALKQEFLSSVGRPCVGVHRSHILHLSDLHLGSGLARRRLPRVQNILKNVVNEIGDQEVVIPVITGDLMDTPSEENLADFASFVEFLKGLGIEEPVVVIGNHDVRQDGWLSDRQREAIRIPHQPVYWFDNAGIAFACFNSVNGGRLARGRIGEEQLLEVGNALDRYPERNSFTLISAVHHHPIPVDIPEWYRRKWYEWLGGPAFEKTEALEDAPEFMQWLHARNATAVLHGHKHIPRFAVQDHLAIIGCGSTVGKVDTNDQGQTYMSLNLITVDKDCESLSCRLRAERIPGGGLEGVASHEMVLRSTLNN